MEEYTCFSIRIAAGNAHLKQAEMRTANTSNLGERYKQQLPAHSVAAGLEPYSIEACPEFIFRAAL